MKICIFCASAKGIAAKYHTIAEELGKFIAENNHTLLYGGSTGGLMDSVAAAASKAGGEIVGVIPEVIIRAGRKSTYPTRFIVTNSMAERKSRLKNEADMFIVLPGGYGTLDEMFDVIASGIVGEHNKPLICFNFNGVFDSVLTLITNLREACFIPEVEQYKPNFINDLSMCKSLIDIISEKRCK